MTLSVLFCLLPLASALQPQRMTHRKTLDGPTSARSGCGAACLARGSGPGRRGRLCSAEYTQNGVTFSDCTTAANPDGVAGKEWCAVEPGLAGSDWAYCAPKIDYGAMRSAAEVGYAAKAEESHRSIMSGSLGARLVIGREVGF